MVYLEISNSLVGVEVTEKIEDKGKREPVSRTRDLVDQIKQITIEIRDIKERRRAKIDSSKVAKTINAHSHIPNGPLQEGHEEHDEDGVHYKNNIRIDHPLPGNRNNQIHCVPTQYLPAEGSTASQSLPPQDHPSLPSNGSPSTPTSMTPPCSTSPSNPKSPENREGNVVEDEETAPWKTMVNSSSCVGFGNGPGAECKKEGV